MPASPSQVSPRQGARPARLPGSTARSPRSPDAPPRQPPCSAGFRLPLSARARPGRPWQPARRLRSGRAHESRMAQESRMDGARPGWMARAPAPTQEHRRGGGTPRKAQTRRVLQPPGHGGSALGRRAEEGALPRARRAKGPSLGNARGFGVAEQGRRSAPTRTPVPDTAGSSADGPALPRAPLPRGLSCSFGRLLPALPPSRQVRTGQ